MKTTAQHRALRLSAETIRSLHEVGPAKSSPMATTLSACRGGCKANTSICSL